MTSSSSLVALSGHRLVLAIVALAVGGFAIGTTEFVTMGLLPQIAAGVGVAEPTAAHAISAYALGVVVGVPTIVLFGAQLPRRAMLIGLMVAYAAFNLLSAAADSHGLLVLARFLDGLPHGAYFGVASLVAVDLAAPEHRGRAVASVLLGLSIANVVGVPAATWVGQELGWRAAYILTAALAAITVVMVAAFVPRGQGQAGSNGRQEAREFFSRRQVWMTLAVGSIGFGGLFTVYSYIASTVTETGGLGERTVLVFLVGLGLGMTFGTWLGGELAAKIPVLRALIASAAGMVVCLLIFWAVAPLGWWLLPVVFTLTAVNAVFVTNLQLRFMDVAGNAVTLGAAMVQAALNVANALGAWVGGLVITAGAGYQAPALAGAALAAIGVALLIASALMQRRTPASRHATRTLTGHPTRTSP